MVHVPPAPDSPDRLAFTPVATRPRRDGWTAAAQVAFIAALATGESVAAACRRVRRSPKSAYALRQRADAASFAAAWDFAVGEIDALAMGTAFERCAEGTLRPVLYRGRIVGERRVHDDRLLMQLLRRTRPQTGADPYATFERSMRDLNRNNFPGPDEIFA